MNINAIVWTGLMEQTVQTVCWESGYNALKVLGNGDASIKDVCNEMKFIFNQCEYNFCVISHSCFHIKLSLLYTDINDCQPDPCENNGTCTDLVNDYQCDCVAGFNGTNCENSTHCICLICFEWNTILMNVYELVAAYKYLLSQSNKIFISVSESMIIFSF